MNEERRQADDSLQRLSERIVDLLEHSGERTLWQIAGALHASEIDVSHALTLLVGRSRLRARGRRGAETADGVTVYALPEGRR